MKHNACSYAEQVPPIEVCANRADRPLFEVTVPGRPIVKKNTQKVVRNRWGASFKVNSRQYNEWFDSAVIAIRGARPGFQKVGISRKVRLEAVFCFADGRSEPDLSNLYEGIQDVLVSEGVLEDDRLIYSHDGSTKVIGDPNPRTVVRIWGMPA